MLPIGKFLEPNYGKLAPFIGLMIIIFYLVEPNLASPCYYGNSCKFGDAACVADSYESLSSCNKNKTYYALGYSAFAYLFSCAFFLGYKLLRNEAYSYYYEQG